MGLGENSGHSGVSTISNSRLHGGAEVAASGGFLVAVLQGVDVGTLRSVLSQGTGDGFQIYCVDRSLERLASLWESTGGGPRGDRIVFFHGGIEDFDRAVGVIPSVVVANDPAAVLGLWGHLPPGARIAVPGAEEGLRKWEQAGWITRLAAGNTWTVFRTGRRHQGRERLLGQAGFRQLRCGLNSLYFSTLREGKDSQAASVADVVGRVLLASGTAEHNSAHEDWPNRPSPDLKLPDHLPDGSIWPLISIVTPSFQQGQYLEETILSVAHQNYPRVEHILIDGGSTDESLDVISRHRDRLAVAISEKDRGQSHAINKGMAFTTGEILTWLNSDDCLARGALAGVAMGFHTSRADMVAGIVDLIVDGEITGRHLTSCDPGPLPLTDLLDLDGGWNAGKFFYQPEVMFSRDIWEKAGGKVREDLYYSMDFDLWVRFAEVEARLHVIGRSVARFRIHPEQKTNVEEMFKAELRQYTEEFIRTRKGNFAPTTYEVPQKHTLRIVMLNDHGYEYGAGIAHQRTADSLTKAGHEVIALALRSSAGDGQDSGGLCASDVLREVDASAPDLVISGNLHSAAADPWILGALAEKYSVQSVLHDFWILTGRCAYPADCEQYLKQCTSSCPTASEYPSLAPEKVPDAYRRKQDILFSGNALSLLANSDWATSVAIEAVAKSRPGANSPPVERMRLSFPLDVFMPLDKQTCRRLLGLPEDRFLVMLSGDVSDARKRAQMAFDALQSLELMDLTVIATGWIPPGVEFGVADVRRTGHISDASALARYYAAADLYISPSRGETFGQVFLEAIACGTPAIGFANSGIREALRNGLTGLLVAEETVAALAGTIRTLYSRPELRKRMAIWGRLYAENEWSPEAAYYSLFLSWRRLGLLRKWKLPPKISFVAESGALGVPKTIVPATEITFHDFRMGGLEGPYPEFSLDTFRWAYGPVSEVLIQCPKAGRHSLVIRYRNLHPGQRMRVVVNGEEVWAAELPVTGIASGKMACLATELRSGGNDVALEFSRWQESADDPRPLAAVITEMFCMPDNPD